MSSFLNLSNLHVLVLEDEVLIRMDVEAFLADMGCTKVTSAPSVSEAIEAFRSTPFELAVLDVHVAGGATSYEFADLLASRDIPFIFASGSEREEIPERFANVPFVTKPFDVPALQARLASALEFGAKGSLSRV